MRVAEARTGKNLGDSKITVAIQGGLGPVHQKVNNEYQVNISKAGIISILAEHNGYFDSYTKMSINCPLPWDSCEKCQEGLDILIPLFKEKDDIGPGKWSASITWSQVGPHKLFDGRNLLIWGLHLHGKGSWHKNPDYTCSWPWGSSVAATFARYKCKANLLKLPADNRKTKEPMTLLFEKDPNFAYILMIRVGIILD